MNYKMIINILGKTMLTASGLMLLPMFVGIICQENNFIAFLVPILIFVAMAIPTLFIKVKNRSIFAKEGFVIVALAWIILSLIGALPFVISGEIPNYIDALFETVSGFTTTGSTILSGEQIESLSKASSFWRIFTHWIGGMGVLVFVLALIPSDNQGIMHVYRSESPGPSSSKLVSKIKTTTRILYLIYLGMTVLEIIFLAFSGISFYECLLTAFSTAGTGGFSIYGDSLAHYANVGHPNAVYIEMVVACFMFLFALNFNVYYLILTGGIVKALRCEEVRAYFVLVLSAVVIVALNIMSSVANFGEALRYSFFQVSSISSTTGFTTYNYDVWPGLSKAILLFLMVIGACGGSTAGGLKVSRVLILAKSTNQDVKKMLHPRATTSFRFENEPVNKQIEDGVRTHVLLWLILIIISTLLLSIDGFANTASGSIITNLSSTITCISNVGPGLGQLVGATGNFAGYNAFSKIILSVVMLAGRLEILPILILFSPHTWVKGK